MELSEQVDLINGYEEWKARKKQEALDYSAEAYLRDTAKETALSNLEGVVDYIDEQMEIYGHEEPMKSLLQAVKYLAT